jgi:acylphosphatase
MRLLGPRAPRGPRRGSPAGVADSPARSRANTLRFLPNEFYATCGRGACGPNKKLTIQLKLTHYLFLPGCDSTEMIRYNPVFEIGTKTNMLKVARKFLIRGNVQGVGYRFFAQRAAARHQVVGYVRNCADGTVEALAEGPARDVEEFRNDLAAGPQWASVDNVEEISLDPTGNYSSFRIER